MAQTQTTIQHTEFQTAPLSSQSTFESQTMVSENQTNGTKSASNLIQISQKVLEQPIDFISTMSPDIYIKESKLMPKSTIGKHIRHMVDHFRILLSNPDLSSNDVNYDLRIRKVAAETDPAAAVELIRDLEARLPTLGDRPFNTPLILTATIDPNLPPEQYQSSFGRELWYCCIHAIHHYASIKTICLEHDIQVPDSFGVAPSTLQHAEEDKMRQA
ncbi:hypothetical protein NQZ79_g5694 [Umbelopsis isabellina]|nr:hypothetical protein NQZ79_g5694 [Umbelopsis isabellina]